MSIQRIINRLFTSPPLTHNLPISKRHNLRGNHTRNAPLAIAPPEQVRNPRPPRRVPPSASRPRFLREHERQAPSLRRIACLGIEFRERVRLLRFRGWRGRAREVWELGDLVFEHVFDGLGFEDLLVCLWGGAVVEEGG